MKCITFHVGVLSRRKGRSAVQMAAYCARERFENHKTELIHDYTSRGDLVFHEVFLPPNAPREYLNSETLWNAVEEIEKSKNARLARTLVIGIPRRLDIADGIVLVCAYVKEYFVKSGMCVDVSVHDNVESDEHNPHAHVLLTTRSIDSDGKWMFKQRRNYLCDAEGNRLIDPVTNRFKLGKSIKANDWDEKEHLDEWRKGWADMCNQFFREKGIKARVTHLSYKKQGLRRKATKHLSKNPQKRAEILRNNEKIKVMNFALSKERENIIKIKETLKQIKARDKGGKGR